MTSGPSTFAVVADLDARYGRTPGRRRRRRAIAVVVGALVLATVVAWVLWVGLLTPQAAIDNQDIGFTHLDATTLRITEQISTDPGTRVTCSFEGMDTSFAIVGWKVVDVPASARRTFTYTATIRLSQPAVNGTVGACWPTAR